MQKEFISHDKYTNQLFNDSSYTIVTNNYKNLIDKDEFKTKLTGVSYGDRQSHIKRLEVGQELFLIHDINNESGHENAIKVTTVNGQDLGFLPRELADEMIKVLDDNNRLVFVEEVTGDQESNDFFGVNIAIQKIRPIGQPKILNYPVTKKEDVLFNIAKDLNVLEFYEKNKDTIEKITRSNYVALSGNDEYEKKLIIAIVSIYKNIKYKQKIIFLYTDRNTMMEDSRLINTIAEKYTINIEELNPEKLLNETFGSYIDNNAIDILVATYNQLDNIKLDYEFGLVVHNHIDQNLKFIQVHQIKRLNAKTAIFNQYDFKKISKEVLDNYFSIKTFFHFQAEGFVTDVTLVDKRNIKDKELYIYNYLMKEKKSIIYVNTRKGAVDLAKRLRSKLAKELKNKIIFYHAGLHIEDKKIIETKFKNNEYLFVIATTAFDIALSRENIVQEIFMYNPAYSYNTFLNQVVQTAKHNKCTIHFIYSHMDVHHNKSIVADNLVDKSDLTYVYKALQNMLYLKIKEKFGYFQCKNHELRAMLLDLYSKTYQNNRLESVLKTLDEMKVINFERKSNDYFVDIYDTATKAKFEETKTYLNNLILVNMFIELEVVLTDTIQNIHSILFNNTNQI
jgi:single-stranded-DNA-specific exonuclease